MKHRPGIVAAISEVLAEQNIMVESLNTQLQRHVSTGTVCFHITADCVSTKHMSREQIDELVANMEAMKKSLDLDIMDIRVQRLEDYDFDRAF